MVIEMCPWVCLLFVQKKWVYSIKDTVSFDVVIEKPLEMPCWNLLCLRRICLFVYVFSITKNKITKPYAMKFDGLLVNNDRIVN